MVGLIILSLGTILMIYALRAVRLEASNGTLIAGAVLVIGGIVISLSMNKQK